MAARRGRVRFGGSIRGSEVEAGSCGRRTGGWNRFLVYPTQATNRETSRGWGTRFCVVDPAQATNRETSRASTPRI
jgi:hypothetical protein